MKALLLAAGFGTRLRPITDNLPKCLVPIHNKALLAYWLDLLFPEHFEEVLINTHYLPEMVNEFVNASPWGRKVKLVHEETLLGTGGTIYKNRDYLQSSPFLLAHADNLTRFDVSAFIQAHYNRHPSTDITMMTFDTDAPHTCGIVELNENNIVINFHEKSTDNHGTRANAAVYIFEPSVISYLESLGKDIIDISTEVLPHFMGRIQAYHNADYHRDIGTPESLRLAEVEF